MDQQGVIPLIENDGEETAETLTHLLRSRGILHLIEREKGYGVHIQRRIDEVNVVRSAKRSQLLCVLFICLLRLDKPTP